jgi:hypothetical protein
MAFAFDEARFRAHAHLSDRLLGQLFNRCNTWAFYTRRKLGVPTRNKVLAMSPVLETIIGHVAAAYGISVTEFLAKRRQRELVHARHVAMWIAHREFGFSLQSIADALRKIDHTTVLHGVNKLEQPQNQHILLGVKLLAATIKKEYPHVQGLARPPGSGAAHHRPRGRRVSRPRGGSHDGLSLDRHPGES